MDFVPGGELSRRIREGDVSAESELIRQFEPGLRVLLRRRTGGDYGLLQDLVQETLLVVIQRLRGAGIEDPQKLAAFAAQTARNLAIASLRKAERQKTDVDSEATDRNADPTRAWMASRQISRRRSRSARCCANSATPGSPDAQALLSRRS